MKFDFKAISDKCVKCGKCIQVCTIYGINSDEVTSPRGFLDLLGAYKRGELELDKDVKNIFESCFLCTNCVDVCPGSLHTDTAIENVRKDIADKFGITWYKKVAFWFLGHRTILDLAARMGYVFQSCGFKIQKDAKFGNSMSARLEIPLLKKERLLPTASKKSFMNSHPDFVDNGGERTIGLFIGCMGNYAYTSIGEGVLKICKTLGINVDLMKKQACCGAPMYFTGEFKAVEKAAKFNVEYFEKILEKVEAIVIPEATCSAMVKMDYIHFFEDDKEWQERAKKVSQKIYLATEYFYKFTNLEEILAKKGFSDIDVTCHDPCHARKMQGVYKEPRALLAKNYKIVEMQDPNKCCGFGGVTMQSNKYELSRAAGQQKVHMLKETGVKVVSAECSACKMQLNNALHIGEVDMKCVNPIELIGMVLDENLEK
ncbi:(Fe-S)-binding protein [Campylobacter geochelonis]|uniref:(Fe-S)-binding protein n=1 Tax=Campylobacter geochelonis TaxID=1780362 RepID=UPI000770A5D9|nr:(Fe-S)-binding protein [Campylobacter geochelonis]CZE50584.1 iron-sulfur cluster-binding domain-containing protein [Campylobacter geochelonis]